MPAVKQGTVLKLLNTYSLLQKFNAKRRIHFFFGGGGGLDFRCKFLDSTIFCKKMNSQVAEIGLKNEK